MMENLILLIWLCVLTTLSLIFAVININHLMPFWTHKKWPYIKRRKPSLLIIYIVLASIALLIILPNICVSIYVHSLPEKYGHLSETWFVHYYYFIFNSIHDSIFCTFINIIAIRVWLLFYDHKFAIATVDRIWRNVINPNDNNFFLNRRNTFGNDRFLLKILFIICIFIMCIILFIVPIFISPSNTYIHIDQYLFVALRICIALPVAIFIFVIYHKIKRINDQFNIRREMQILYYLVGLVTFISIIGLIVLHYIQYESYIFETMHYSLDIIFIFSSCYIQTKWILNLFMKNVNDTKDIKTDHQLSMVDVLQNETSFEAFMRHCVNELSYESLLFLIEVAQYKATLTSYNAPDKTSQFYSLNVQKVSLRQILLQTRHNKLVETGIINDVNDIGLTNQTKRATIKQILNHPFDAVMTADDEKHDNQQRPHKMSQKEGAFRQFQSSILERKWLPIALQLRAQSLINTDIIYTDDPSKTSRNLKILPLNTDNENEVVDIQKSAESTSPKPTPSTFKLVTVTTGNVNDKTPNIDCTATSQWIRDFACFLYEKYIKMDSDLSVNISSITRNFLTNLFNKSNDAAFEYIIQHSGGEIDENKQCPAAINQKVLINTYLFHVFDEAFEEIWNLLRENSFTRFTMTETYQRFVKEDQKQTENSINDKENVDSTEIVYRD